MGTKKALSFTQTSVNQGSKWQPSAARTLDLRANQPSLSLNDSQTWWQWTPPSCHRSLRPHSQTQPFLRFSVLLADQAWILYLSLSSRSFLHQPLFITPRHMWTEGNFLIMLFWSSVGFAAAADEQLFINLDSLLLLTYKLSKYAM